MAQNKTTEKNIIARPPVVAIMGHVDHGKSTLLDYIRKTNIVEGEAGGITQRISAYEVVHKNEKGEDMKITFLDTPGHEAFSGMRERGAQAADIAILIVSAEDSVKAQTIEAYKTIQDSGIPFIVAINKIDRPGANIEKVKMDLAEKEIYLEGYGGKVPCAEISAKQGTGVNDLLNLILLAAELENFTGDTSVPAEGIVLESNLDPKRGLQATLIVKNGTLKKGMVVKAGTAVCGTRIMEDFLNKQIDSVTFSSPVRLVGFDLIPKAGDNFRSFENKKDAESATVEQKKSADNARVETECEVPLIIKADTSGTLEALEKEVNKIQVENCGFKIVQKGIGAISETDLKSAEAVRNDSGKGTIIAGFNIKMDNRSKEMCEKYQIVVETSDIIYKLTDWLKERLEERRPKEEKMEISGKAKILKTFSRTKEKQIVGGKVTEGKIVADGPVRIMRREAEIGRGKIVGLEKNKVKSKEVEEGSEFGMMVETKIDIASGDVLESFIMVNK
jgi:translation initiation factor IF-2